MMSANASLSEHLNANILINDLNVETEPITLLSTEKGYINYVVGRRLHHTYLNHYLTALVSTQGFG